MWSQLAVSLQHGNPYMIFILVLGFFGTVVIVERFIMLQFVYHIDFGKFLGNLKKIVQAEDLDRALNLCKSASHTSLPHISLRAIEASETDPTTVRGTIEEETIDFLPKLEARLNILPAFATLILLLGVLGTIDGLWSAFDSIEVLDTSEKQARLAHGIAGSLNPTTMGLLMCMIFLACHQMLKSMAIKLTEKVHYGVAVLSNLLVPPEVAAYVPMAAGAMGGAMAAAGGGMTDSIRDDFTADAAPAQTTAEDDDDSFDDASVEDIKDEEEII